MHWLDIVILVVLGFALVSGATVGAVRRLLSWAALLVAFSETWRVAPLVERHLLPLLDFGQTRVASLLVWVLSFLLLYLVLFMAVRLFALLFEGGLLGVVNRVLGAGLSFLVALYALGYVFELSERVAPIETNEDARLQCEYYSTVRDSVTDLDVIKDYLLSVWEEPLEP